MPSAGSDAANGGLRARLQADLTAAMKKRAQGAVSTLRGVLAAVMNEAIAQKREDLPDADILRVLEREAKRRREAADVYDKGQRPDRAKAERAEADLIAAYLPSQLSDAELEVIVREAMHATPDKNIGKIMGAVMAQVRGKADGTRVKALVSRLAG